MRKLQENKAELCDPSFFETRELLLEYVSRLLPGAVYRPGFMTRYSLLVAVVIQVNV